MKASEAHEDKDLRARVAVAAGTTTRTVADLLDGYSSGRAVAGRIRRELAREGVDLGTVPRRSQVELNEWKVRRYPKCARCRDSAAAIAELRARNMSLDAQLAEEERQNASLRRECAAKARRLAELEAAQAGAPTTPPPIPLRPAVVPAPRATEDLTEDETVAG